MQLRAFRDLSGHTLQQVADAIGVANAGTVEKHEKGYIHPSPDLQAKYLEFTKGAVTAQDWFELSQQDPPPRRPRKSHEPASEAVE